MRKTISAILAVIILLVSASSLAEYQSYRVSEGDAGGDLKCIPLDAHNTVVIARSQWKNPWHVTWYRDGELYRDLSGPTTDPVLVNMEIPWPAVWDGERLVMLCSAWTGDAKGVERNTDSFLDPDNYQSYLADWTESGLVKTEDLPESWYRSFDCGKTVLFSENGRYRIHHGGSDTVLPESFRPCPEEAVTDCIMLADDVFLLGVLNSDDGTRQLVCIDHGTEKYRTGIPDGVYLQAPDGQGGFLCPGTWPSGDYEPMVLRHYNADGVQDRTLQLGGSNVVVQFFGTAAGGAGETCVLYGSAVANSRKVYTVFSMVLDAGLNVISVDVRNIDPDYGDYNPKVIPAPDGTPWVLVRDMKENGLRPVLIPFDMLEKSRYDQGLALRQQ